MIARLWHGRTKSHDANACEARLKPELLPGIGTASGYMGIYLPRREGKEGVEFITIMP